jgi:hypothetical protein
MSAQLRAGHIPADMIPPGVDPRTVVIVHHHPAARSYTGPIILTVVVSAGAIGVVMTLCLLLQLTATTAAAVAAAAPAGVGLSIPLARRKGGK